MNAESVGYVVGLICGMAVPLVGAAAVLIYFLNRKGRSAQFYQFILSRAQIGICRFGLCA